MSPPTTPQRPLSPHLMIYRKQLTSMLSISHRISGVVLSGGMLIVVALLYALVAGPEVWQRVTGWLAMPLGQGFLIAWSLAFFWHFYTGLRHLFWDAGYGFELKNVYASGYATVAAAVLTTALVWGIVYYV